MTQKNKKRRNKKINHRVFFSSMLICLTWLVYSACHMAVNGGMTYDSVTNTLIDIIPYCFAIGALGFVVGYILDKPTKQQVEKENQEMLDKLLKQAADQAAQAVQEARMASEPASLSEDMPVKVDTEAKTE